MSTPGLITEINQLTESVRNHINTHRYQIALLEDAGNWNQICSSLDVVGDSLLAIESYHKGTYPDDFGLKYIYTYGVLQALFLLQDAARHLSEAFTITYQPSQALLEIRNMRNAAIGHPTKQDHKGQRYYNYISRISMSKNGFDLLRHSRPGQYDVMRVDLTAATTDQLQELAESFRQIVSMLEEADRMHKEKFEDSPLEGIFHSAMGYFFEKIGQGIHSHSYGDRDFGHTHVRLVLETYEKFRTALHERNELNSYTEFDLDEYFHALRKLDGYLGGVDNTMEEADARIYLSYLRNEHDHFVQIAKEIDGDFQAKT
jgi:uncharacterized protein with HEPN domain